MGGTLHRDSFIGLECQKEVHNLVAGNLHKTGTAFVTQADLDFLIFVQRNKIDAALCKLPIQKLETAF